MWIKTSNGQADITYMGLPPGNYTLCVRVLHDDGTMEEDVSELDILILSPWYRSWWAWILYALLIGLLIFGQGKIIRVVKGLFNRKQRQPTESDDEPTVTSDKEEEIEEAIIIEES